MPRVDGFVHDKETGNITMYQGDTGSFWVHCARKSGEDWTSASRMLYTIKNGKGETVIQRIYRLDDQYNAGDGYVLIEFHNNDTDSLDPGNYTTERRYDVAPVWEGTPSSARCVNALTSDAQMVEGVPVRTVFKGTLTLLAVDGRI